MRLPDRLVITPRDNRLVNGLGIQVQGDGIRIQSSRFRVFGLRLRVFDFGVEG